VSGHFNDLAAGAFLPPPRSPKTLAGMIPNLKVEVIDPVLCKGVPSKKDLKALDDLAAAIAEKHKEHNFT